MTTLFSHDWTGSDGAAWDSGVWSFTNTGTPTVEIDTASGDATGRGQVSGATTDRVLAHLQTPLNTAPVGIRQRFRTAGGGFLYLFARASGTWSDDDVQDGYRLSIQMSNAVITPRRYINSASTNLTSLDWGSFSNNTDYWVYWEVFENGTDTTLRWRIWQDGTSEPSTWNQELTDNTAGRPSTGSIGIGITPGAGALYVDDLTVTDLATGPDEYTGTGTLSSDASLTASGTVTNPPGQTTGSATLTSNASLTASGTVSGADIYLEISTGKMLNARYSVSTFDDDQFYEATVETPAQGDWSLTYSDTSRYKTSIQGKLLNIRVANALFEDEGSGAYPAGLGSFDPATNTSNFIAALDTYKDHGVLAVTVSLQGGNPGTSGTNAYGETGGEDGTHEISAFNADGTLKGISGTTLSSYQNPTADTWADRFKDVCAATKTRGMFVILNLFYQRQDGYLTNWTAVQNAITQTVRFLVANNYRHVLLDIANEYDNAGFDHAGLKASGASGDTSSTQSIGGIIQFAQAAYATARTHFSLTASDWRAPAGASSATHGAWTGGLPYFADVAFPHGNEIFDGISEHGGSGTGTDDTAARITRWRNDWEANNTAGPIVMNEDDNSRYNRTTGTGAQNGYFGQLNVDLEEHALDECLANNASWGLMHRWLNQYTGQPASGYDTQSPNYWRFDASTDAVNGTDSMAYFGAVLDLFDGVSRVAAGTYTGSGAFTSDAALTTTGTVENPAEQYTGSATLTGNASLTASGSRSVIVITHTPTPRRMPGPPQFDLLIRGPLPDGSLVGRQGLSPELALNFGSELPGGWARAAIGIPDERIRTLYRAQDMQTAMLPAGTSVPYFAHVELYEAGTGKVWEGRASNRRRVGGQVRGFNALGYGSTGLRDDRMPSGSGTARTAVVVRRAISQAAPHIELLSTDDPNVMRDWAEFSGQHPVSVLEALSDTGTGEVRLTWTVYDRKLRFFSLLPPDVPEYRVPADDTVEWDDDWENVYTAVELNYTDLDGVARSTGLIRSTEAEERFGVSRVLPLNGGQMTASAAAAFARTELARRSSAGVAVSLSRDWQRGLETSYGSRQPVWLVQAGQWLQVGDEPMQPITGVDYDQVTGRGVVRLGQPVSTSAQAQYRRIVEGDAALRTGRNPVTLTVAV